MTAPADASYFREDVLAGRVALVTGGGSGIGFEVARQFGLHGCAGVVLVGRRPEFLQQASALLAGEGIKVATAAGDVRKPEDCENAVKVAVETFGGLDILVNAAAGNFLAAAEEISSKGFKTVMDIDTLGTFNMCRSAFEPLKSSRFGGVVVSITATLHYTSTWYQAAPVAAKAAIDALTRTLALEWGEYGVRCNCVAPGPIADTPGMEKLSGGKMDKVDLSHIPAKRAGTKAEIAAACIFLCLNNYITGQILPVDGGEWFGKKRVIPREMVSKISRGVAARLDKRHRVAVQALSERALLALLLPHFRAHAGRAQGLILMLEEASAEMGEEDTDISQLSRKLESLLSRMSLASLVGLISSRSFENGLSMRVQAELNRLRSAAG